MTNNKIIDSTKFFPNLTDKNMLKKLKIYDELCKKYKELEQKVFNLRRLQCCNQQVSDLYAHSTTYYNYLQQDIDILKAMYRTSNEKDFLLKTKRFTQFISDWWKIMKTFNSAVLKLEQKNNNQNPHNPENTR